jgi:hypothetical protein
MGIDFNELIFTSIIKSLPSVKVNVSHFSKDIGPRKSFSLLDHTELLPPCLLIGQSLILVSHPIDKEMPNLVLLLYQPQEEGEKQKTC